VDIVDVVSVPVAAVDDVSVVMVAELSVTAVTPDVDLVFGDVVCDTVVPVADEVSWNSAISKT
jgi:hypothetical protein